ncbi:MAG: 4Fe-4S dicluster domain-containing protein [Anaerolineae bacterium]
MSIDAKLALDAFKIDEESHIQIDEMRCKERCQTRYCLYVCPAQVYTLGQEGEILIRYEGCLECGACTIACDTTLAWNYPRGGFGVQYRFG